MPTFEVVPHRTTVPDWVCEVLSPSTRRRDLVDERRVYREWGVGHFWIVDPAAEILEGFRLTAEGWTLTGTFEGDDTVALEPFAAAPFGLAALWPPLPARDG
ncbi:Uma2 family endonuclease [Jannaschia sp. LMIT008]|uniref:Uma2 family endonuclease n=1 Tax=Jannaschia maritima TaxID=3032585 RepID=UPI0028124FA1|nr:Uma2 family endonuclease [Jannaschia sp. LMIT008]